MKFVSASAPKPARESRALLNRFNWRNPRLINQSTISKPIWRAVPAMMRKAASSLHESLQKLA
ncbi:MAG: hypothetical protein DME77_04520 [Verrucomicrobia bacterium]|nr:MAG: hypothetical protein DME77_04520 [Verrucomicrobiota bacterium]